MTAACLSQIEIGDIGQIIIVVLILAASAWKKLADVLIKKFSPPPRDEADPANRQQRPMTRRPPPLDRPVARPMPTRVERRTILMEKPEAERATPRPPRSAIPEPLREILAEIMPDFVPPAPKPLPPPRPRPQRQESGTRSPEIQKPDRSPRPRPQAAPRIQPIARPAARPRRVEDVETPHVDVGAYVEGHIGHLDSRIKGRKGEPSAEAVTEVRGLALFDPAQLRDRSNLCRAIILSEILSPPIALRTPDGSMFGF